MIAVLLLILAAVAMWPAVTAPGWPLPRDRRRPPTRGGGRVGRGRRRAAGRDPADLADLVAMGLEAGLPVAAAVALAGATLETGPGNRPEQPDPHDRADLSGRPELPDLLATALLLSERVGAPVAKAARVAAEELRHRARAQEQARALAAGPQASMALLTVLPIAGPGVVLVLGLSPAQVYGSGLAMGLFILGSCLTGAGWVVSRSILRRAMRPTVLVRPPRR